MRFFLIFTVTCIVFVSQFVRVEARAYKKPARQSSLHPYSENNLLYRDEQLDPALMRRSPPEEVLNQYARQRQAQQELLTQLTGGRTMDLFALTGSGSGRLQSRYPRR